MDIKEFGEHVHTTLNSNSDPRAFLIVDATGLPIGALSEVLVGVIEIDGKSHLTKLPFVPTSCVIYNNYHAIKYTCDANDVILEIDESGQPIKKCYFGTTVVPIVLPCVRTLAKHILEQLAKEKFYYMINDISHASRIDSFAIFGLGVLVCNGASYFFSISEKQRRVLPRYQAKGTDPAVIYSDGYTVTIARFYTQVRKMWVYTYHGSELEKYYVSPSSDNPIVAYDYDTIIYR